MSGLVANWSLKILTTLLLVVLLTAAGCIATVALRGARYHRVVSESMEPGIKKGDLAVVLPAAGWPRVGEVVSYNSSLRPGEIVTHRVMEVNLSQGYLVTKGDNLPFADTPIRGRQVIGIVFWHSTIAGKVADILRRPIGLIAGIYLPGLLIITWEVRKLLQRSRTRWRYMLA